MIVLRLFTLFMFVMLAAAPSRAGQAAACPPYSKPIVLDFKTLSPKPVYNNRLTIQGIRNLFRSHTDPVLGPHERALGITYAETTYTADARSSATQTKGGYCVYLTSLDIQFGWKRMEVYVAAEFEPGTCEYRSVLDHENQHVAVNNGTLRDFAPHFRAEVEKMLRQQQPVYTRNAQAGMDAALANVNKGMSGLLNQFQGIMAQRNAPLDTTSNYEATGKLCQNWNGASPPQQRQQQRR
jgi:hypothetical protein